jgi:2-C-methyl-D-erythritol 4-phosphate cytidylyltransferase
MDVSAVVVAGGAAGPDLFAPLAGVPVIVRSVQSILAAGVVGHVTLLVSAARRTRAVEVCAGLPVTVRATSDAGALVPVVAHVGERSGAAAGDGRAAVVLVHDAARPLSPPALAATVVAAVRAGRRAVVPVLPLADTVKQVDADGRVLATPDRAALRVVQTPQAVHPDLLPLLAEVIRSTGAAGLGPAAAAAGEPVHTVAGDPAAFSISTPWDLELAEMMLTGPTS